MAWLTGWSYRKSHVISGSSAGAQTNYQVPIIVYYGSGTDSGENVYLSNKCKTDFGDIRFTSSDGSTLLDYYAEEIVNSNYAKFWVRIPSIPAFPNTTSIYVYYGNSSATSIGISESSMFDIVGNTSASASTNVQYTSTRARFFHGASAYNLPSYPTISRWVKVRVANGRTANVKFITATGTAPSFTITDKSTATGTLNGTDNIFTFNYNIKGGTNGYFGIYTVATSYIGYTGTAYSYAHYSGEPAVGNTYTFTTASTNAWALIQGCFRKYVEPEPSHSTWGNEEQPGNTYSTTLSESVSFNEVLSRNPIKRVSEVMNCSDSFLKNLSMIREYFENVSLNQIANWVGMPLVIGEGTIGTIYGIWYLGVVLKEQAVITDTFSKTSILWKTLNESVSLLRVITIGSMRTLSETLSFADTLKRSLSRTLTDSVANTDIFSRIATLNKLLNETLSGSDVIRRNISRAVSETLPLIDVISKGIARVITNSLTFADVVNKSVSVIKAESIMLVRSLTKGVARLNSEVINFTDVVRKGISLKAFSEAISLIDTVKRSISRILQESISLLDTVWAILPLVIGQGTIGTIYGIWHKGLTLRESIEFSDVVASNIILSKILIENIALVSAIARSINIYRYITEQIAFNDVALKGISRKIIENVLLLSVYSKVISKRLIENLVLYSVIPFFISKSLTELIVSSDSIKKSVVRTLQESLGIPDYFLTNYIRVLSEVVYLLYDIKLPNKLILQETINLLQHNIIFGLSIDKVFSENVNISDMIGFGYFEALFELLSLSDTLKKHPNKLLYELVMEIEKRLIF